jgi:hypothetical protein
MLGAEISSALRNVPGVVIQATIPNIVYEVSGPHRTHRCFISFHKGSQKLAFLPSTQCDDCVAIFSQSFPPTNTFLQRKSLMSRLKEPSKTNVGCLCCYKVQCRIDDSTRACARCVNSHTRETLELAEKWWLIKELTCPDVARVIIWDLLD